jgi:hypothetical protein
LTQEGRDESSHDPKDRCQYEAGRLIGAWHDELRNHACHEADDDGPKNAHDDTFDLKI